MSANNTPLSDSTSSQRLSISSFLFPKIRLPPQNQTIVSHDELELHLSQQSDLKAAFIATYGAPGPEAQLSGTDFLSKSKAIIGVFRNLGRLLELYVGVFDKAVRASSIAR